MSSNWDGQRKVMESVSGHVPTRLEAHAELAAAAANSGGVEVVCRACGTVLMDDMAAAFDRRRSGTTATNMTALAVMES